MTSTPRLAPTRYALTYCGNAERLRDAHGDSIRFSPEQKQWYAWGGARWVPDRGLVVQLARKTIRSIPVERAWLLEKLKDDQLDVGQMRREADALANWARLSEGAARIRAMLEMAKTEPSLTATPGGFDQDPWLLNLTNGTLELKSGRCRVHRSQDRMTKMANAEYQPEASCPSWMRFLGQVFAPHLNILPFIQRAVGYSLSGEPK